MEPLATHSAPLPPNPAPVPEAAWRLSPQVFAKLSQQPVENSHRRIDLLPSDPEFRFVHTAFSHQQPTNRAIKRVICIHNGSLNDQFEASLPALEEQANNPIFAPDLAEESNLDLRHKALERFESMGDYYSPFVYRSATSSRSLHQVKILPLWHGSREDKCESICQAGFTFFGKHGGGGGMSTDQGFFGSGIYFTTSARYAADIYSDKSNILLAWVAMRQPYPVVSNVSVGKCSDMKKLETKGAYQNYSAHYIPVHSLSPQDPNCEMYYPCHAKKEPELDEIVVFSASHTLPRFWVEMCVDLARAVTPVHDDHPLHKLSLAAEQGDENAQYQLACCYLRGHDVLQDDKQGAYWLQKGVEQGHAPSQALLGALYAEGKGVPQDHKQAAYWFQKAAEQEDAPSQFLLGALYTDGEGVPQDHKQAAYWFQKAALQGLAQAQIELGKCYFSGRGVLKDGKQAAYWFQKAAEREDAPSQFLLGAFYTDGEGVPQDHKQAAHWFQKAAEQGFAEAQFELGQCYLDGRGVPKDEKQAAYWFQKAAEQGLAKAQLELGKCYISGRGVLKDGKQGAYWLQKGVEQEHAPSQYLLGALYADGVGVPQDHKQAAHWYQRAAEQGLAEAQFEIAVHCRRQGRTPRRQAGGALVSKGS